MRHTFSVNTKTLAISAAVLTACLAILIPIELHWLMNMWKGE